MTDADLLSRILAYDRDGILQKWTPEAVQFRLIEAYRILDRTPMRLGPKGDQGFWPGVVFTVEDLVDEKDRQRLLAAYGGDVNWEDWIDESTIRQLSQDHAEANARSIARTAPNAAAYSRAEESLRWAALYLDGQPLLADAVGLWAYCRGAKRSIRETMKRRQKVADLMLARMRVHPEVATLRVPALQRGGNPKTRQEVMPGRNFDRTKVGERRKKAVEIICAGLISDCVLVRAANVELSSQKDRRNPADDGDED